MRLPFRRSVWNMGFLLFRLSPLVIPAKRIRGRSWTHSADLRLAARPFLPSGELYTPSL